MDAEKQELLAQCYENLNYVAEFLEKYLALANLHNTNFIISDYWNQIPESIKKSLECLPRDRMSGLLLKETWRKELKCAAEDVVWCADCSPPPREMVGEELQLRDTDQPLTWHHSQLDSFMADAASCHLDQLSYPRLCEKIYNSRYKSDKDETSSVPFVNHAMGEKKGHEVELLAQVCCELAERDRLKHVVDLGSGKGYLATTLAMQYGYSVIGIDSQEGNTHGAMQRKSRLEKQYDGLVRKVKEQTDKLPSNQNRDEAKTKKMKRERSPTNATEQRNGNLGISSQVTGTYTALTAFIGPEDDLQKYVGEEFQDNRSMLTGLHTCGNLAVSMAKLFLRSRTCRTMINVSCCYHLVDEMFVSNPYSPKVSSTPHFPMSSLLIDKRFKLGRNCRMLSMQAMEKLANNNVEGGLDKSLFWRALLQKILLDMHGFWRKDWIVGKIASKCADFNHYVSKAMKKLNIDAPQITDKEIAVYLEKYGNAVRHMAMFFQLRTALSPAIESAILLDRCLYLLEQDDTDAVILKRLFDPVQSPRCYGIIASKRLS